MLLGLLLQFVLGLLILRTRPGYLVFKWIGDRISIFVTMSDAGAKFLFGDTQYLDHFVAFKVRLPAISSSYLLTKEIPLDNSTLLKNSIAKSFWAISRRKGICKGFTLTILTDMPLTNIPH